MAPTRRSQRLSGARTKYTDDPFEAAGLSVDSTSEDNSSYQPRKRKGKARKRYDDSSDEDFTEVVLGREEENEMSEGDEDASLAAGVDDGSELYDDYEDSLHDEALAMKSRYRRRRQPGTMATFQQDELHNRGIFNPTEHVSKSLHMKVTFGTDDRDLLTTIYGRDRWFRGIDSALPSRTSLDNIKSMSDYGPGETFGVAAEELEAEATTGWDWYYDDNSGERFRKRQRIEKIDEEEARQRYLPKPQKKEHTVIIGPVDNQKEFRLQQNECLDFGEAWNEIKLRKKRGRKPKGEDRHDETKDGPSGESAATHKRLREGWILNMGGKVQCLAWAPNQDGATQYLAIAVPITEQQRREQPVEGETTGAPSFTPSKLYPAALQIWSFEASEKEGLTMTLDMSRKPTLRLVICTDWGDIRRIAWCPMARRRRNQDDTDGLYSLGLLAGIWGDGTVKVLDIKLDSSSNATEFCKG